MDKRLVLLVLALVFLSLGLGFTAKIEVFTADNVVQMVKEKIIKTRSFSGSFVYVFNNRSFTGEIKYKSPNKFLMNYMTKNNSGAIVESGQKIVSDGKSLWLVFKDQNVAINESLEKSKHNPMIGWNIERLMKEYVPTVPKSGYKVQYGNAIAYKIIFVPKSNTAGFRYINMIVNDGGDIQKVEAQNQIGGTIELAIKYDAFNQTIADEDFEYEPDEDTQIYENILLPKGQNLSDIDNPQE